MGVCGCEEDESQMLMADSLWEMTSNIKEVMEKRQIEKKSTPTHYAIRTEFVLKNFVKKKTTLQWPNTAPFGRMSILSS